MKDTRTEHEIPVGFYGVVEPPSPARGCFLLSPTAAFRARTGGLDEGRRVGALPRRALIFFMQEQCKRAAGLFLELGRSGRARKGD